MAAQAPFSQRGQATVEWVGLVGLVALAFAVLAAVAGIALPGAALARTIAGKIVCGIGFEGACLLEKTPLVSAYGAPLAAQVADHTPQIRYEAGMKGLPIDYRECREDSCGAGPEKLRVWATDNGLPASAFTHIVDCRPGELQTPGADCGGDAAGNLYIQYWLYYTGSATGEGSTPLKGVIRTVSAAIGHPTYHRDDWESLQLRIHPDGAVDSRASSHLGYGPGWMPASRAGYTVSGGSHAGTVEPADFARLTPAARLTLIPLEPIAEAEPDTEFAITPPWRKKVWFDPEYEGTD